MKVHNCHHTGSASKKAIIHTLLTFYISDRKNKALYSRVLVDEKVKNEIPRPRSVQPLTGRNGLTSREVVLLDSRTIVIKDFSFRGRAPNTHFLVGVAGTIPNDIDGFVIPNEKGTDEPLGRQEVLNSPRQFCII